MSRDCVIRDEELPELAKGCKCKCRKREHGYCWHCKHAKKPKSTWRW